MPIVLLVRHGRTDANASGVLAGRTPGVRLDETGEAQVTRVGERLAGWPLARVVSSPLERCLQTARALGDETEITVDERLIECEYGRWTGLTGRELRRQRLWRVVQEHPSAVVFPGGESMAGMQARAVAAVREHDAAVAESHGPNAVWVAVSHGDVIKSVVADALGMHLDHFQRLVVNPASVTAISYTERRPFLLRFNDTGDDLQALKPGRRRRRPGPAGRAGRRSPSSDGVVGGGAG